MKAGRQQWKVERRQAKRKLQKQEARAGARAKYGPKGKPSKVVRRTLDGQIIPKPKKATKPKRRRKREVARPLEARARSLGFVSYRGYLQSKHWRALRQVILDRDDHQCTDCHSSQHLNIHHKTYKRLGSENLEDLITLCEDCHAAVHVK